MPSAIESSLDQLRQKVRGSAENRPGVYRMLARSGVVIYVGKSKRVRTRLMGYFRAKSEEKAWRIIREARAVEWEYVPSEFASLLRELELIKRYRPQYNVQQKRDGLYSFLKLSNGGAPRLNVVRRISDDPARYFGPLRGGQRVIDGVRELNDALGLRDCRAGTPIRFADQQDLFGTSMVPLCTRHELGRCLAPCAARCTEADYAERVGWAEKFLIGESDGPLEMLRVRMDDAARRLEFEHAANLRDRIGKLEYLRAEFQRLRVALFGLTFVYAVPGLEGDHRVYAIRAGSIRAVHPAPRTTHQRRRLISALEPHLRNPEAQDETASRERIEQILLVAHWFRTRPAELARTYPPERISEIPLRNRLKGMGVA